MSKSPSLRRIQADIRELALDPSDRYYAHPLEHDMFEWHFTVRGADDTDFEGGIYHGRILLPPEYPFKPPHILFLTPSGRFETNKKVCLSFSAYHPELWQPAWGIRLILEALISFMPTSADGAVGALDWSSEERKRLAKQSRNFCCPICGKIEALLPKLDPTKKKKGNRFTKEIEKLQELQQMTEGSKSKKEKNEKEDEKKAKVATEAKKAKESSSGATSDQKMEASPSASSKSSLTSPALLLVQAAQKNGDDISASSSVEKLHSRGSHSNPETTTEGAAAVTTSAATTTDSNAPRNVANSNVQTGTNAAVPEPHQDSDLSWMYDPLLNLMIVLSAAVCCLLWQKFVELREELAVLREQNLLLE